MCLLRDCRPQDRRRLERLFYLWAREGLCSRREAADLAALVEACDEDTVGCRGGAPPAPHTSGAKRGRGRGQGQAEEEERWRKRRRGESASSSSSSVSPSQTSWGRADVDAELYEGPLWGIDTPPTDQRDDSLPAAGLQGVRAAPTVSPSSGGSLSAPRCVGAEVAPKASPRPRREGVSAPRRLEGRIAKLKRDCGHLSLEGSRCLFFFFKNDLAKVLGHGPAFIDLREGQHVSFEGSRGWDHQCSLPACSLRPRARNIQVLPADLAAPRSGPDSASPGGPVAGVQPPALPLLGNDATPGDKATPSPTQGPGTPDEVPGETSDGTPPVRMSELSSRPGQPREQKTKRQAACGRTRKAISWEGKRAYAEPPKEGSCDQEVAGAAGEDADGCVPVPAKSTGTAGADESGDGSLKLMRCPIIPKRFLKGGSSAASYGRRCLKVEVVPTKSAGYVPNLLYKTGTCRNRECGLRAEMRKNCRFYHAKKDRRTHKENLVSIGLKGQPERQARQALTAIFGKMAGGKGEVAHREAVEKVWFDVKGHEVASHTAWVLFSEEAACKSALL